MRISDLLGKEVITESGWSLGSVFDVRVEARGGAPKVKGLVVGAPGLRRRLVGESHRREVSVLSEGEVPWDAVESIESNRIRVGEVPTPVEEPEGSA
jgi:sporulation protein YlmC with PRC-barrel domain